jgi:hypothetical protein
MRPCICTCKYVCHEPASAETPSCSQLQLEQQRRKWTAPSGSAQLPPLSLSCRRRCRGCRPSTVPGRVWSHECCLLTINRVAAGAWGNEFGCARTAQCTSQGTSVCGVCIQGWGRIQTATQQKQVHISNDSRQYATQFLSGSNHVAHRGRREMTLSQQYL